jgi:hypothetical protein
MQRSVTVAVLLELTENVALIKRLALVPASQETLNQQIDFHEI